MDDSAELVGDINKEWNWDAFKVEKLSGNNSLVCVADYVMERFEIAQALNIKQQTHQNFFKKV